MSGTDGVSGTHTVFVRGTINGMQKNPERHLVDELGFYWHGAILGVTYFRIASPQDGHVGTGHTEQSTITIYCLNCCVEKRGGCAVWIEIDHVESGQGIAASLIHEHDGIPGVNGGGSIGGGCYGCWFFRRRR